MRAKTFTVALLSILGIAASTVVPPDVYAQDRWSGLQFIGPDTISDIVTASAPSVVNLTANRTTGGTAVRLPMQSKAAQDANKKIRRYYGLDTPLPEETLKVTGTGIVVSPDGYIITCLHVVENSNTVTATFQDGRAFQGNVVARDRFTDLALVKIPATGLQPAKFGNSDSLRLGDWVIAIGDPYGLTHSVTHGLISGLGRESKGYEKSFGARTGAVKFIQTDAPINSGNSGGPLINLKGEVIGMNTFIRDDAQNIGFAIPSNVLRDVSEKLVKGGSIAHPYIGITMKDQSVAAGGGVEVSEVKFKSPAAAAGILPGDVIMVVEGTPASKPEDISGAVSKHKIGEIVHVKVKRNGADKDFDIQIQPLPEEGD